MTIWTYRSDRSGSVDEESDELSRFDRIAHRRQGECPVRSHAARTRARMRSRGGSAARRKARAFNGAHRRGQYTHAVPGF